MPMNNIYSDYSSGQQIALDRNAIAQMVAQQQRESDTRNAYAQAMQGGGDEGAFQQNAYQLGTQGNMEGSQQLLGVVAGMDKVKREKLSNMVSTVSPYFNDIGIRYQKALLDNEQKKGTSDYKSPQQVFTPFQSEFADYYKTIDDPYMKQHLPTPDKFNPLTLGTLQKETAHAKDVLELYKEQNAQRLEGLRTQMEEMKKQYDAMIQKGHDEAKKTTTTETNKTKKEIADEKATKTGDFYASAKKSYEKESAKGSYSAKRHIESLTQGIEADLDAGRIDEEEAAKRQKYIRSLSGKKDSVTDGAAGVVQNASKTHKLEIIE